MEDKPLTTFEVADYCQVTHRTVQQWITAGKLTAYRTPGHHNRVTKENFLKFLKEYQMPVPEDFIETLNRKKRILVVDDDETMVLIIKKQINPDNRYEIGEAFDGFEAGKKFAEFKPDLITLDIKMPKLDGFGVLKLIRQDPKNKNVKIIVITGVVEKDEKKKIIELGANEFMVKPFGREELIDRVENLLEIKP